RRFVVEGHARLVPAPAVSGAIDLGSWHRVRSVLGEGWHPAPISTPVTFVEAGRHVWIGAVPAAANAPDDATRWFLRGRGTRDAARSSQGSLF
ncbi:MAG: hypothetical protein ABMB14_36330, partial [Myxococcota bacterium]